MPTSSEDNQESHSQLSELLASYLQRVEDGERLDREQMYAEHPHLAEDLKAFFDDHDWMQKLAGSDSSERVEDTACSLDERASTVLGADRGRKLLSEDGADDLGVLPRTFGDYELLEEIGRGGMGVIYKARQRSLNRIVALKMILSNRLASMTEVERFYSEAETVAGLDHPGIVSIFEVGKHEDQHFYSMAYVEGLNLGDLLVEEGLVDPRAAAELVRRVAEAIGYAHDRGVIHRDLKPANILLSSSPARDGVWLSIAGVTGHYDPKVTDFGLAKRTESNSDLTGTGQVLGTPSYMPPEQAAGNTDEISPLSDVYSLGALLYCLLTGRPPFRSASVVDTLQQVLYAEPVPPRQVNPAVPRDLETICLKCLQKNPSRRYGSACELADDLRRYRDGEPLTARPIGQLERAWKLIRRRPTAATLVAVGLVAIMAIVGLTVSYSYQVERERLLYYQGVWLAYRSWQDSEIARAQELLAACPEDLRGWEWHYVQRLCHTGLAKSINTPRAVADCATYDRSGRYLASCDRTGAVHVWDAETGQPVVTFHGHERRSIDIAFSPDGRRLASSGNDGTVRIWSLESRRGLHTMTGHEGIVWCVAFSPDGRRVVSGGEDGTLRFWNADDGTPLAVVEAHAGVLNSVDFSSGGQHIATAGGDGTIRIWTSNNSPERVIELKAHVGGVNAVEFGPRDLRLASAGEDGTIKLWDMAKHEVILTCEGHVGPVNCLCFGPDGNRLASGGQDLSVRIWDAMTGRVMLTFFEHTYRVAAVDFHPDGRHLASAGNVNNIQILDVGSSREATQLGDRSKPERSVAYHSDGELLASAGEDGLIRLWQLQSGELLSEIAAHDEMISTIAFSPGGDRLASASHDHTIKIWKVSNGQLERDRPLRGHTGEVYGISFSPDGTLLASAGHDGTAVIWETSTGRKQRKIPRETGPVTTAVFSPDGERLAVGGWDKAVLVYNVDDVDAEPLSLTGLTREVLSVAFSPDGNQLIAGDKDGNILVWNSENGRKLATLTGHLSPVTCVTFSPRGDRIASASWDGSVKIWEIQSQRETLSLNAHNGRAHCVVFSPSGEHLASAHHDGTILVWGR